MGRYWLTKLAVRAAAAISPNPHNSVRIDPETSTGRKAFSNESSPEVGTRINRMVRPAVQVIRSALCRQNVPVTIRGDLSDDKSGSLALVGQGTTGYTKKPGRRGISVPVLATSGPSHKANGCGSLSSAQSRLRFFAASASMLDAFLFSRWIAS